MMAASLIPHHTGDAPRPPQALQLSLVLLLLGVLAGGCAGSHPYTLGPIKTEDPDQQPIPAPAEHTENMYWDRADLQVIYQLEKPLNLNWVGRQAGRVIGIAGEKPADNVNVLDEPPNSSWWTRRHFYEPMTYEELAIGPNRRRTTGVAAGPDTSQPWTVTSGKFEGASRGFQIQDARGDRYLIKLDGPDWPELTSSAEVIATKIFYAAGYNVPQNTITRFRPDQLQISDDASVSDGGGERPMRRSDLTEMLAPYARGADGRIRAMASKFVDGRPLGPFNFRGRRDDDPNDRVRHEHRRELRGLRVLSSWLNDADRRAANTLDVFTDQKYIRHHLLDMGSTMGANASGIHRTIHGQAYMIDHRIMTEALFSLGAFRFPWLYVDPTPRYKAVGYFRADVFKPGEWVPTYPNPAFEKMTLRDAFWGAKLVMSFSDDDLAAIVETARISDPAAEAHLIDVLAARRDMIGRYWFARINPLDRFRITTQSAVDVASAGETALPSTGPALAFDDLAVTGQLASADASSYAYTLRHDGHELSGQRTVSDPAIALATARGVPIGRYLDQQGVRHADDRVVQITIRTQREGRPLSKPVHVYVHVPTDATARVVGIQRAE